MKEILIIRGDIEKPFILPNGDKYDSTLILQEETENLFEGKKEKTLFYTGYVNTDHTVNYQGGILAEGEYLGICGTRNDGTKAIWLYNKKFGYVKRKEELPEEAFILPSLVPNPNHNQKKIISYVLIHKGGQNWDWSHGCITILGKHFDNFISFFKEEFVCQKKIPEFLNCAKCAKKPGRAAAPSAWPNTMPKAR